MRRVAIVGSRGYPNLDWVREYVRGLPPECVVVSGGARGVDTVAVDEAKKIGLDTVVYHADWDTHGKRAGFLRNATIVDNSDEVVAFWDGKSRGTMHTVDLARKQNIPYLIFGLESEL